MTLPPGHPLSHSGLRRTPGISSQSQDSTGDTGVSKTGYPVLAGLGSPVRRAGRVFPGHQRISLREWMNECKNQGSNSTETQDEKSPFKNKKVPTGNDAHPIL